ncbi:MAG TPA: hypothetical protein VN616_12075 [Puia sp.]|nr:hypothetical protein [Puia sp.]
MKRLYTFTLLALAATIGMTACSSSKSAQGSADLYSSGRGSGSDYVAASPSDQYVQMKSQDYYRWSYFDDYNAYDAYYAPAPMYAGYGGFAPGIGVPYPCYGFGYSPFFGPSFGLGLGFGDPYMMWDSYFIWNSWYNPYFYNPYYGGGMIVAGKSPTSIYSNLRPFNTMSYRNGLAHAGITTAGRNVVYRPGMRSTSAYNSRYSSRTASSFRPYRPVNTYRPVNRTYRTYNQPTRGFSAPVRTYSPPVRSFGGGGGGFRPGGFGRH